MTEHDLGAAILRIRDDGIIEFEYGNHYIDLATAMKIVTETAQAMPTPQPHPTMIRLGRVKGVSRDAREFFSSSEENMAIASKVALLAGNPVARIVGNFFLGLNRPPIPTKLFGNDEAAIAWLKD